jgi:dimethylargininase
MPEKRRRSSGRRRVYAASKSLPAALVAITRPPTDALARCELTYLERRPIDAARALEQHRRYEAALRSLGAEVVSLPPEDSLPDACFVEDTALVLDEVVVMANPGAESRRGEVESVAEALAPYRRVERVDDDAKFDGGDVLRVGCTVYVGLARRIARTNEAGADAIRRIVVPLGYQLKVVPFDGCLHLQSAVTRIGSRAVLVNPDWVDPAAFEPLSVVHASPREPGGANALFAGGKVIVAQSAPETAETLRRGGYDVLALDVSEFEKAEAGLTCLSLLI